MKDLDDKSKFIELRALGKSFESISRQLNISKPTLLKWSRDMEAEIINSKAMYLDEIKEKYLVTKEQRVSHLKTLLDKADAELLTRDFVDVPTEKLVKLKSDMLLELEKELTVKVIDDPSELIYPTMVAEREV